ncbi:hypothetical protein MRB53_035054 [Persea americana]|uniref:Uncharacterized protein n=1 Tax=Persea americana TaxID=3435 RepID=A0ACC2K3S1_PERAE|nr:hypothetical protein MRB53_035054 [Persea americana]
MLRHRRCPDLLHRHRCPEFRRRSSPPIIAAAFRRRRCLRPDLRKTCSVVSVSAQGRRQGGSGIFVRPHIAGEEGFCYSHPSRKLSETSQC